MTDNSKSNEQMIYRDYFCGQLHLNYTQACIQHNFIGKDGKFYSNCPPKELQIPWSDAT